jgi:hypothetical protein
MSMLSCSEDGAKGFGDVGKHCIGIWMGENESRDIIAPCPQAPLGPLFEANCNFERSHGQHPSMLRLSLASHRSMVLRIH